jgi:hypothetical protein
MEYLHKQTVPKIGTRIGGRLAGLISEMWRCLKEAAVSYFHFIDV